MFTASPSPPSRPPGPPNIVLIIADDLGYGDLSCYGTPLIKTPNLDRLASEGLRFTDYRTTSPLCTPSRGSLITGLYPPRTGLVGNLPSGYPSDDYTAGAGSGGIDEDEITLAEALRTQGYRTAAVGKWHLGHQAVYLPMAHGFESYFGIPSGENPLLLLRGTTPVSNPVGLDQLTRAYTEEAVRVIREAAVDRSRPFFLYLAHKAPHVPLLPGPDFLGKSAAGRYGDVVEELDWSVGEVVKALKETGQDHNTLLWFTSDNGPWLAMGPDGGSAGPLQGGKGNPYEGGLRLPAIAWWPAGIRGGRVIAEPVSVLDLFPTFLAAAGGQISPERKYYGSDLRPLFTGEATRLPGPGVDGGREMLAYVAGAPAALRVARWKWLEEGFWAPGRAALYDLEADLAEQADLSLSRPDLANTLSDRLEALAHEIAQGARRPQK